MTRKLTREKPLIVRAGVLLILAGIGFWLYQSPLGVKAKPWTWEDQVRMEVDMAKAVETAPGRVPEIDRAIPQTRTALFALG